MWRLFSIFLSEPTPLLVWANEQALNSKLRRVVAEHADEVEKVKAALGRANSDQYFADITLDHSLEKLANMRKGCKHGQDSPSRGSEAAGFHWQY